MKSSSALLLLLSGAVARCETFDYVFAGAGTAALVIANRLTEDPGVRVALIEAGGDERDNPDVYNALETPITWRYDSVPQPHAANRSITYYGGKAIGGSSNINGMYTHVYVGVFSWPTRGHPLLANPAL